MLTYAYTAASNILASYTTGSTKTTIATNANGNITSIPPANSADYATFGYNVANRLSSVVGSPTGATFLYDAFGQRFSKADPGSKPTTYIYRPGGTLLEENDNGAVTDYLYANGRPVGTYVPSTGKVYFIQTDHLGTPQLVTDSTQKTVWKTTYQPFGTTGLVTASTTQNLRFPGQYADTETGFNYNLNRDYMPNLGRYLETDPVGIAGGINPFIYADANGISNTDIPGLSSTSSDTDFLNFIFNSLNTGSQALSFFLPRGVSIQGPLQFLGLDSAAGAIYTDIFSDCSDTRTPTARYLDAAKNSLGLVNSVIPKPFKLLFLPSLILMGGQAGIQGLQYVDNHLDSVLDNSFLSWVFAKSGLDYRPPTPVETVAPPSSFEDWRNTYR